MVLIRFAKFRLECNDGKGHRFVKYDIDKDGVLKPIKIKQA